MVIIIMILIFCILTGTFTLSFYSQQDKPTYELIHASIVNTMLVLYVIAFYYFKQEDYKNYKSRNCNA
jgi:hypothetical protein